MSDGPVNARQLLDQAHIALQYKDRQAARRLAQMAASADPELRGAWLLMAELSSGSAQRAYIEQAARLSPENPPKAFHQASPPKAQMDHGSVSPIDPSASSKSGNKSTYKESTQPIRPVKPKGPILFLVLTALILSGTLLVALSAWLFIPTGQTVSAVDHSSYRQAGDLPKPTLTLTVTPEPTPTVTATFTMVPTWTMTSEPVLTNTPEAINLISIPGIPDNIIEGERWIDVDLTHQRTSAFEGSTLIRTFIVSTGTQYHPTVTGQYYIYVKYRYDDMAGPGYYLPDVPYTMYFYKGYSLHGTYWHDNFGVPMSHGCINMTIADSEWLYYWASIGTLVNIHY